MTVRIGSLEIDPPLAVAPMVGLSHSALRSLLASLGGVGLFYSEMLSAKRLPSESRDSSPGLIRGAEERPLVYQLYATESSALEAAVAKLEWLDAQGIDLNLGCPAPQLRKIGAGAFLLDRPDGLQKVLRRLRAATQLPISVKIRIGPQADGRVLRYRCLMLEEEGVDLIIVHARLTTEKFCRRPRWHLLQDSCEAVGIPIFANGGIFTVEDARNCLAASGAAGLMIGRGAVSNPFLIRDIAREIYGFPVSSLADFTREALYFRFIELLNERFPSERRLGRLKQFTHYFAAAEPFGHELASRVQSSSSMKQAAARAHAFFSSAPSARETEQEEQTL